MNKQEAIAAMRAGKRITHNAFCNREWMTIDNGQILLEDGVRCPIEDFFSARKINIWNDGYSVADSDVVALYKILNSYYYHLYNEKYFQEEVATILKNEKIEYQREYRFDPANIVDFFVKESIAVELKITGQAQKIYRQLDRYCSFNQVKAIILLTNRAMGLPSEINNKPAYLIQVGLQGLKK